jgi:hypothetical protein
MKAPSILLDYFSGMKQEFISNNNRVLRNVDVLVNENIKHIHECLCVLNRDYELMGNKVLNMEIEKFSESIKNLKVIHVSRYLKKYSKELEILESSMSNFFNNKVILSGETRRRLPNDIKKSFNRLCEFDILQLEEDFDNLVYDFKSNFENKYISSDYSKDDFNKVVRTFKHDLLEQVRSEIIDSIAMNQDILSRYISRAYDIVENYREKGR